MVSYVPMYRSANNTDVTALVERYALLKEIIYELEDVSSSLRVMPVLRTQLNNVQENDLIALKIAQFGERVKALQRAKLKNGYVPYLCRQETLRVNAHEYSCSEAKSRPPEPRDTSERPERNGHSPLLSVPSQSQPPLTAADHLTNQAMSRDSSFGAETGLRDSVFNSRPLPQYPGHVPTPPPPLHRDKEEETAGRGSERRAREDAEDVVMDDY